MSEKNTRIKLRHDKNSHTLPELTVGDKVLCQNVKTKKWDRSGEISEVGTHRQYTVRMDGSARLSSRNRRHLQKISYSQGTPTSTNPVESLAEQDEEGDSTAESPPNLSDQASLQQVKEPTLRRSARSTKNKKPLTFSEEFGY